MKKMSSWKKGLSAVLCLVVFFSMLVGLSMTAGAAAYDRLSVSLNGIWDFYPNNGTTRYDIYVPSYWDTPEEYGYPSDWRNLNYGVYKKQFTVPTSMADSQIFLEIGALTALGEVYVNGNRVGGEETQNYLMMMLPYQIDVTPYVTVGAANNLEVRIYGSGAFPSDAKTSGGKFRFPVGTEFISGIGRRGICDDVNLISKPKVHITDVQIITDLNKNTNVSDDTITLKITVKNCGNTSKTISISNSAALVGGSTEKTFANQNVTVAAGASATVTISNVSWTNAKYWWPHDPKLYNLTTTLKEGSTTIDSLSSRFGFRQFYVKSGTNYFELNGIRANLRGDSLDFLNSERNRSYIYDSYIECPSNAAIEVVKKILYEAKELNMNIIRNHIRSFVSDKIFDYADEIGMMMIDEGAFWETHQNMDYGTTAVNNCKEWVKRWVKSVKNHPSIVMYSATNEAWGSSDDTVLMPALRDAILSYDTTRPIFNDGEGSDLACHDQVNLHYSNAGTHMAGFPSVVNASNIYSVYTAGTTKPMGEGEAMTPSRGLPTLNTNGTFNSASGASFSGDTNVVSRAVYARAVGRITRGARYTGIADFRPFCDMFYAFEPIEGLLKPQWSDLTASGLKPKYLTRALFNPYDSNYPDVIKGDGYEYYKNSFSPVAAFDKAYDNANMIGVNPIVFGSPSSLTRTIVVYNDEFTDGTQISVNWEARYKDPVTGVYTSIASGSFSKTVDYGSKAEQNISFSIPSGISGSKQLYLKLSAYKNSVQKFSEDNMIGVINSVPSAKLTITNPVINLGQISLDNYAYKHRIKLVNAGGGLAENWTASGYGDWLNLETTSGILRGEQEVYFTINTSLLSDNSSYSKTLTFTGAGGTSAQVTIQFTTGTLDRQDNLALYAAVTASSSYESSSWKKIYVVDGQKSSVSGMLGWTSNSSLTSNHTEWVTVDLGSSKAISTVDLYPRNDGNNTGYGFPIDFTIQVSSDNTNWTTVVTKTGYALPGNKVQRFTFSQTNARYVKVTGTSLRSNPYDANQYRMQFAEICIYKNSPMSGATVTASSTKENASWGLSRAVDGITGSVTGSSLGWTSDSNTTSNHTEWVTVDLGSSKNITTVDLYPRNDGNNTGYGFPVDFTISISSDNNSWTTVANVTGYSLPGDAVQRFTFSQVSARYVKITGTSLRSNPYDANQYRLQFAEIEVF